MDEIVFIYDPEKNPDGKWIDGVPLDSLSRSQFEALPAALQAAVKREAYYVPVKKTKTAGKEES